MACPICDQKPMNCDCTPEERRQYGEICDLEEEVVTLRLTDKEREAIEMAIDSMSGVDDISASWSQRETAAIATLRGLLERLK